MTDFNIKNEKGTAAIAAMPHGLPASVPVWKKTANFVGVAVKEDGKWSIEHEALGFTRNVELKIGQKMPIQAAAQQTKFLRSKMDLVHFVRSEVEANARCVKGILPSVGDLATVKWHNELPMSNNLILA